MYENEQSVKPNDITFYTFEAVMAREERHIRRLIIALIIAVIGIVISNAAWLYVWMQYDYSDSGVEVSVDGEEGGNASYIGTRGMIINGEGYSSEVDQDSQEIWK